MLRYGPDEHYDVVSAFIKSMRGSDPDAALHYLARMLHSGEDPRFVARRLVIQASEDVGMADPMALVVADAAARAVEHIGMPEAQLTLAQATVHIACAPKSNRVALGIWEAIGRPRPPPSRPRARAPARRPLTPARPGSAMGAATATPRRSDGLRRTAVPP